ncbi:MAG: multiheme c-type cytochrome [Polyangiales bacterium]
MTRLRCLWYPLLAAALLGCEPDLERRMEPLTRDRLLDPESCKDCHPKYYREWSSSMHAYAMQDPVFIAMNKRGQEETNGALGDFCVKCHAPMAVRENAIGDFADLTDVPKHLQGVTCYFCHNAVEVGPEHFNAAITLANDDVMRANIRDPVEPTAHRVARSPLYDAHNPRSAELCGTCHDIVTPPPQNVHLERTFAEYKPSVVALAGPSFNTCQHCHMPTRQDRVAVATGRDGELTRRRATHEHLFAAVDVALTDDFPNQAAMRSAVESCELPNSLASVVLTREGPIDAWLLLETNAGHNQPSGATHDRRLWAELTGYDGAGNVVYMDGQIPDGAAEHGFAEHPCMLRDVIRDETGKEVHMFWDAENYPDAPLSDKHTMATATVATQSDHALRCRFRLPGVLPARIVVQLKMRAVAIDVLQDLVDSGHLDPSIVSRMPTLRVSTSEFYLDADRNNYSAIGVAASDCSAYVCMLDPEAEACGRTGAP